MKIREIMKPPSWAVRAEDTVWRAERIMARRRHKHLPVLEAGKLIGIVSEREVLALRAQASTDRDWWLAPIRQVMHPAPITAAPDESALVAVDRLAASPDGFLPVIEHGCLVGIVTASDVLDAELRSWVTEPAAATAADVMTDTPEIVAPTDTLVDAANVMVDSQIRHLPVVENGTVIGMLSDRDIRTLAGDPVRWLESRDQGTRQLNVRDAMTNSITTVTPETSLAEVARVLADERIGAVPVVDDNCRPIGIISYVDLLRALAA